MKISKQQKGFTLIELLVVVAIIGLLSSVVLASLTTARLKAQGGALGQNLKQLQNALELYSSSNSLYPKELLWDSDGNTTPGTGGQSYSNSNPTNDFTTVLQPLITQKYISSIPITPDTSDLQFIYWSYPAKYTMPFQYEYYSCGGKPFGNYTLLVIWNSLKPNNQVILSQSKLPEMIHYIGDGPNGPWTADPTSGTVYCITN